MNTNANNSDELIARELTQAVSAFAPPAGLKDRIRERIRTVSAEEPAGRRPARKWPARALAAAAAVGLVLVSTALLMPNGNSSGAAYAALMEAVQNSEAAEWAHIKIMTGDQVGEAWVSVMPLRQAMVTETRIQYLNVSEETLSVYDPAKNALTVQGQDLGGDFAKLQEAGSIRGLVMSVLQHQGDRHQAKMTQIRQEVDGKLRDVFTLDEEYEEKAAAVRSRTEVYVDVDTNRVERLVLTGDRFPQPYTMQFDYPETGPLDIYALGVPRDAKVVETGPTKELLKLHRCVEDARNGFAPQYRAIICTLSSAPTGGKLVPIWVRVVHRKGARIRSEHYNVPRGTARDLVEDVNVVERLLAGCPLNIVNIPCPPDPDEGPGVYVYRGGDGGLVRKETQVACETVESLTWALRQAASVTRQIPEAHDGLVGTEYFSQGHTYEGRVSSYPCRTRQFYNPSRDYTCERMEQVWDAQAPWQEDKDWLKDVEAASSDSSHKVKCTAQVVEYAQTDQGRWYAKRIRREEIGDRNFRSEVIVHLDTSVEVPDELFDPDTVSAEMFQPK